MAVSHADSILTLQENLSDKEMPPQWKWHLPWEMERHMERVVADRKAKYGGGDDDDDPPASDERWEVNELAESWKND